MNQEIYEAIWEVLNKLVIVRRARDHPINELMKDKVAKIIAEAVPEKFFDNPYVKISKYARYKGEGRNEVIDELLANLRGK